MQSKLSIQNGTRIITTNEYYPGAGYRGKVIMVEWSTDLNEIVGYIIKFDKHHNGCWDVDGVISNGNGGLLIPEEFELDINKKVSNKEDIENYLILEGIVEELDDIAGIGIYKRTPLDKLYNNTKGFFTLDDLKEEVINSIQGQNVIKRMITEDITAEWLHDMNEDLLLYIFSDHLY